jgi:bifunctional UDP-N-acetylglucosamine pyrophosphorylase/glucosamine-1-phosphate N-acetyltransferase/UDP-N-acetylglucosamine pyrophosphorylase
MSQAMTDSVAVVLAAGKGTRMKSDLPKVLTQVNGRPMIEYVLDTLSAAGVGKILVVVGYRSDLVREQLAHRQDVSFVEQTEQLGTGHAVMVCREALADHEVPVIIVAGDSPMLQQDSVAALLDGFQRDRSACIMGTTHKEDPTGLGRIVRDDAGEFLGIVEEKDATPEQRAITEVNMSTYLFDCQRLLAALEQIRPENAQGEYYITDCPGILKQQGQRVQALPVLKAIEALSINTLDDLAAVEEAMRQSK